VASTRSLDETKRMRWWAIIFERANPVISVSATEAFPHYAYRGSDDTGRTS
jgi:hypothetical protein